MLCRLSIKWMTGHIKRSNKKFIVKLDAGQTGLTFDVSKDHPDKIVLLSRQIAMMEAAKDVSLTVTVDGHGMDEETRIRLTTAALQTRVTSAFIAYCLPLTVWQSANKETRIVLTESAWRDEPSVEATFETVVSRDLMGGPRWEKAQIDEQTLHNVITHILRSILVP